MKNINEVIINGVKVDVASVVFDKRECRNLIGYFFVYTNEYKDICS